MLPTIEGAGGSDASLPFRLELSRAIRSGDPLEVVTVVSMTLFSLLIFPNLGIIRMRHWLIGRARVESSGAGRA